MKIITWNCQGAFRKKNRQILNEKPDILIVPECENENKLQFGKLTPKPNDFIWHGDLENKGIGLFSYSDFQFELLNDFNPICRYIIPIKVFNKEASFLLFAIWAMDNKEIKENRYIGQIWLAIKHYEDLLNISSILIGDFNSNAIWDTKDRVANHTDVVEKLKTFNIESLYHKQHSIQHGKEKDFTFFMYRKKEKPYHIDYCFASSKLSENGFNISTGTAEEWLELSDHVPLFVTLSTPNKHIDFENSLHRNIKHKLEQISESTQEKFQDIIDKLIVKTLEIDNSEQTKQNQETKTKIIKDTYRLLKIDKLIKEINNVC